MVLASNIPKIISRASGIGASFAVFFVNYVGKQNTAFKTNVCLAGVYRSCIPVPKILRTSVSPCAIYSLRI